MDGTCLLSSPARELWRGAFLRRWPVGDEFSPKQKRTTKPASRPQVAHSPLGLPQAARNQEPGGPSSRRALLPGATFAFPRALFPFPLPRGCRGNGGGSSDAPSDRSRAFASSPQSGLDSAAKMMLSRAKPAVGGDLQQIDKRKKKGRKIPKLEELLSQRDFTGAITLLEFKRHVGEQEEDADLWIGYCAFHLGDYKRALEEYESVTKEEGCNPEVWVNLACTYFFLGMYKQAETAGFKAPKSRLQNRLLFHLAHKFNDEKKLMNFHQNLQDITEDQLSLASIHYMRSHYQEAIDIYKRILLDNREYLALNVYVALCYYKLDYYDVSQEVLAVYLQQIPDSTIALNLKACNHFRLYNGKAAEVFHYKLDYYDVSQKVLAVYLQQIPDSTIALNLKACNHFRLYNGKAAEAELKSLMDNASSSFEFAKELIKHNLVVFRGGEGALQVLPPLVDVIPEARLNLVIYYLRQDDVQEAYNLIKDLEPTTPQEYILKGVVNAALGQEMGLRDHLKIAQQFFQLVGGSASECDTIPGRQCMASCFFLLRQFDDVLIYLNSVKSYFYNDDTFNFNYAQAKAATGNTAEGEEVFLLIQSEKMKNDYIYLSWLARCYIMNKKPRLAWELYLKMETSGESFSLLQLIANDCYKMGQFYYSAKAFDVLERLDPNPEYWEGKRGACVGIFQMILAGREPKETLREVLHLLRSTGNTQVEYIIRIMKKWAKENRVPV